MDLLLSWFMRLSVESSAAIAAVQALAVHGSVCETLGNGVTLRLGCRCRSATCSCTFHVDIFAAACPYV